MGRGNGSPQVCKAAYWHKRKIHSGGHSRLKVTSLIQSIVIIERNPGGQSRAQTPPQTDAGCGVSSPCPTQRQEGLTPAWGLLLRGQSLGMNMQCQAQDQLQDAFLQGCQLTSRHPGPDRIRCPNGRCLQHFQSH